MKKDNIEYYKDEYEIGKEKIIEKYEEEKKNVDKGMQMKMLLRDKEKKRDIKREKIYEWKKGIKKI